MPTRVVSGNGPTGEAVVGPAMSSWRRRGLARGSLVRAGYAHLLPHDEHIEYLFDFAQGWGGEEGELACTSGDQVHGLGPSSSRTGSSMAVHGVLLQRSVAQDASSAVLLCEVGHSRRQALGRPPTTRPALTAACSHPAVSRSGHLGASPRPGPDPRRCQPRPRLRRRGKAGGPLALSACHPHTTPTPPVY